MGKSFRLNLQTGCQAASQSGAGSRPRRNSVQRKGFGSPAADHRTAVGAATKTATLTENNVPWLANNAAGARRFAPSEHFSEPLAEKGFASTLI